MNARRRLAGATASMGGAFFALLLTACAQKEEAPAQTATHTSESTTPQIWFEEVAQQSGVDFVYDSGAGPDFWFPEIMGGGVALFDYDGDDDLDLYLTQGGELEDPASSPANRLYRNAGDGTFEDVTEAAGVGDRGYGMGAACGDYDGDGDVDLYVTNVGANVLYRNEGDGTFSDVTAAARVGSSAWGTSASFLDYDGDGDLDLFVVNNLVWSPGVEVACFNYYTERDYCSPNNYNAPAPDQLFRNEGDGTFVDATAASGIDRAFGNGLGIACGDYDGDGDVDVYVANDAMSNQLWRNNGDGTFEDVALLTGCAVNRDGAPEASMGVQFVDVDHNGTLDLFMTHLRQESNTFYLNSGSGFRDTTPRTGLVARSLKYTGFGTSFHDFDLDGELDLFVANGGVMAWKPPIDSSDPVDAYAEPNLLYRGLGALAFEEILPEGGTAEPVYGASRGAAFGDLDQDGDVDIVVAERDRPARILRNVAPRRGAWSHLRVVDSAGRDLTGTRVSVRAGTQLFWRQIDRSYSYLSSSSPWLYFGLGTAEKVDEVRVVWPGGVEESFGPFDSETRQRLVRGEGREP